MTRPTSVFVLLIALLPLSLSAQVEPLAPADPADVATPEAIVAALYETVQRPPGEEFDKERALSLFLPTARLIPTPEQTGGSFAAYSPREFWEWADELTMVGSPEDRGFHEEQIAARIDRYGDIAHVLSTYQARFWDDDEIVARGINSIQLLRRDGRWWVTAMVWDEEEAAGPLPEEYLPGGR